MIKKCRNLGSLAATLNKSAKRTTLLSEENMAIKHVQIACDSRFEEILKIIKLRKHHTIKFNEYEKLERIFVDTYFDAHPEIDRKKWSSWTIANKLKDDLSLQLKSIGLIRLHPPHQKSFHNFKSNKQGISKILAVENKVKLKKKLEAKQIK